MKSTRLFALLVATMTFAGLGAAPALAGETSVAASDWSAMSDSGETVVATSSSVPKGEDQVSLGTGQQLTGLGDVAYPWYAAIMADGTAKVSWGPGLDAANPTQRSASVAGSSTEATPAATAAVVCSLLVDNVDLSGADMISNTLVTCSGGPSGGITTQVQFRRSSYRGFLAYDGVAVSSPTSAQTQDLGWSALCGAGRGFYDYQLDGQGITGAAGASPHFQSVTANTYDCGGDAP